MWKRKPADDPLSQYRAAQAEVAAQAPAPPADEPRFTAGLPSARPTTAGERHEFARAEKADPHSTRRLVRRYSIHLVIAVLSLVSAYLVAHRDSDHAPAVGECARHGDADKLVKVSCADDKAEFRVTSRVDDIEDGDLACSADPDATTYYVYSAAEVGVKYVLCLAPN